MTDRSSHVAGIKAIPTIKLENAKPGDIVLCHEQGIVA